MPILCIYVLITAGPSGRVV